MAQRTDIWTGSADGLAPEPATKTLKLLVIGASRGTGRQVMQQALTAGHAVVALARDPARIDIRKDVPAQRLSVVRGDVLDPSSLAPAMADRDAVISTLGVTSRAPTTLYSAGYSAGMRNIIQAMWATGVRRLVAVSAAPLSSYDGDTLPS